MHDNFGGGGNSEFSLGWSSGNINIQTPAARSADAITAQSNGLYNKLGYSVSRLQNVTERLSLYAAINGQLALKNLDVSEKMELGGMYAVRAYPEGEGYADEGYVMNLEARFLLPRLSEQMSGHMQLVGFIDSGAITVNKTPWTTEPNHRALYGAGGGFTWMDNNNFSLKSYYAFTLGNEPATSGPDISSGRFWIQIVKYL
jgi:hemolysin activation/secretion protein